MSMIQNNAKIVSTLGQRLAALNKFVTAKTQMSINGKPMKFADVIAIYQAAIDTRTALIEHRAAFDQALAARDSAEAGCASRSTRGSRPGSGHPFGAKQSGGTRIRLPPAQGKGEVRRNDRQGCRVESRHAQGTGDHGEGPEEGDQGDDQRPRSWAVPATTVTAAAPAAIAPTTPNGSLNGAPSTNGVTASH